MAIFSRTSKNSKTTAPSTEQIAKPKAQTYLHVPKHAASDSALQGATGTSRAQSVAILEASRQRLNGMTADVSQTDAGVSRMMAQSAMMHTPLTPSSHLVPDPQRPTSTSLNSSVSHPAHGLSSEPKGHYRTTSSRTGYYNTSTASSNADAGSTRALQSDKSKPASNDSGQAASDSGYSSTRLSSEDFPRSRGELTALPTIESNDEGRASTSPVTVLEASGTADIVEEPQASRSGFLTSIDSLKDRAPDAWQSSLPATSPSMPLHLRKSSSQGKSKHSAAHSSSQQRSAPSSPQLQSGSNKKLLSKPAKVLGEDIPFSAYSTIPQRPDYGQPRVSFTQSPKEQSKLPVTDDGFGFALPETATYTSPAARGLELGSQNSSTNFSTSQDSMLVSHQLQQSSYRVTLPPLSILGCCKVNKFFKVLDDEGREIGELVEGDILDCVRRKVNAFGEVVDEDDNVVGRVRTLPQYHRSPLLRQESAATLSASDAESKSAQEVIKQSPPQPLGDIVPAGQAVDLQTQAPETPTTSTSEPSTRQTQSVPLQNPPDIIEHTPSPPIPTDEDQNASPFAYQGAISTTDGPPPRTSSFGKLASAPQAFSPHLLQVNTGPHRARYALPRSNSNPKMAFASQQANNYPARPSPLSSSENSPLESEETSLQTEDKSSSNSSSQPHQQLLIPGGAYRPPPSESRPRTYFTHSGKVTVQSAEGHTRSESMPSPSTTSSAATLAANTAVGGLTEGPGLKKVGSKKSRFSLGFGKRS